MNPNLFQVHRKFIVRRYSWSMLPVRAAHPQSLLIAELELDMRQIRTVVCAAMVTSTVLVSVTLARESKVALDQLPKAVTETIQARFPAADLQKAAKEVSDSQTLFEVSLKHKSQQYDVSVTADGKIVEIERVISEKDLPPAVRKTLDDKYPQATITVAEEVTKGTAVTFEVLLVTTDKKSMEAVLDPAGKLLEEEEQGDDETKDEDKISLDDVPKAALDSIKKKFPGAELIGAEKEGQGDDTVYEVALKFKGAEYDVSARADGTILETEKLITAAELPPPVRKSLDQKFPKATLMKAEEISKDGKLSYEVHLISTDKITVDVVVDPTGKIVEETKTDDED